MLATAIVFQIGFGGKPNLTPVDDDLEMVLRANGLSKSRDKVRTMQPIA